MQWNEGVGIRIRARSESSDFAQIFPKSHMNPLSSTSLPELIESKVDKEEAHE